MSEREQEPTRDRLGPRLLLLVLGIVVGLALIEIGVRLSGAAPELAPLTVDRPFASFERSSNPILKYLPRPGVGDISSQGLRDREFSRQKPGGSYRIVVLGDSIGFGYCERDHPIPIPQTFAKRLEARLASDPPPGYETVEVINLSVSGYDSVQEAERLRVHGLDFDPDLVLVAYCLNDVTDASGELLFFRGRAGSLTPPTTRLLARLIEASHAARLAWAALVAGAKPDEVEQAPDRREAGFRALDSLRQEHGFDTLVVIFPYLEAALPYDHHPEHRRTRKVASELGFEVLDLLPSFGRASGGDLPQLKGRCAGMHPNEEGHRVAALAIEQFLRKHFEGEGEG